MGHMSSHRQTVWHHHTKQSIVALGAFEMPHQEVPTVHNHEEYEDEPVEIVMFEGFVSKSFRYLNGIPLRKTEPLNLQTVFYIYIF